MAGAQTLTPTLSRKREREQQPQPEQGSSSLSRERAREQQPSPERGSDSLSRLRERARVRARELRGASTDAEMLLWSKLRARQLAGLKFRRQHPVGPYFADFACIELGLVIELDGGQHGEAAAARYDTQREREMGALGFTTLRFWDNEVLNETEAVLEKIRLTADTLTPTLSRKRERE